MRLGRFDRVSRGGASSRALLAFVAPLLGLAAGCGFEHGSLGTVADIQANAVTCACTFAEDGTRTLRIQASSDDAEQAGTTMDLTSGDLDLAEKVVGLRFDDIALPPGSVITSAYVQFTGDQSESGTTSVIIHSLLSASAPTFTTTASDITNRTPLSTASVGWTIDPWTSGAAGQGQRTPDLSALVKEAVELPEWTSASPLVLVFAAGTGHRSAKSFDNSRNAAPQIVITYTTDLTPKIPTCATDLTRDADGFLTAPEASCAALQTTLSGLDAACGLPANVTCTLVDLRDPRRHDIPDSYESDVCTEPCADDPVDLPGCGDYDPVGFAECIGRGNTASSCKTQYASATHAGTDPSICVASGSALAAHALGRWSECAVAGTSEITVGEREPTKDPATEGTVDILGGPCPGGDCYVHTSFLLDMEPITFEVRFARDPTFVDLGAQGVSREPTLLDAGLATYAEDTVDGTGTGRRGSDGLAVTTSNSDPLEVGVDWDDHACDMTGTLAVGVGDDGVCEADGTTPCSSDADCADVGGACALPDDTEGMTVSVALTGELVNQPPEAVAGADQSIECTSTAGGAFTLDGRGSDDPDGNLALASWRAGSRVGAEISDDLVTTQALGIGDTQTYVLRVFDTHGALDEDATSVSVVDTTPPTIACNAPATLRPQDPRTTVTATATDTCDASVAATVTGYECFMIAPNGKRIDKRAACGVTFSGGSLVVPHSAGGVGNHIRWTVQATDDSGNVGQTTCEILVTR